MAEIHGALDIGSNTVRLLVAREESGKLEPLLDRSELVRLGTGVADTGQLAPERMDRAVDAVAQMMTAAREAGAQSVTAVATSAVRDAGNGREFVRRLRDEAGVDVEILSGNREAELTYLGAALGLTLSGPTIFCDLGGGSVELVVVADGEVRWATSLQLGSGRLTEAFIHNDPPTDEELDAVARETERQLDPLPPALVEMGVFTGGTATHLAWLADTEGEIVRLDQQAIERVIDLLRSRTAAEIVQAFGVKPDRARVLPAGIVALQTIARHYHLHEITVTRHGIREGMIVEALRRSAR